MRAFIVLVLCCVLVRGANVLVFCNSSDFPNLTVAAYCTSVNNFLSSQGHTVTFIDSVQLTSADFVGIDVFWDNTFDPNGQTPTCGASWAGTTEPAVIAFLQSGGSYYLTTENTAFSECNDYKYNLVGMFIADVLTTGPVSSSTCTFSTTATLGPEEDPIVSNPNDVQGLSHPCLAPGTMIGASASHIVATSPGGTLAVAYGPSSTTTGAGIIIVADTSTVPDGAGFDAAQNMITFLVATSQVAVTGGDPHVFTPLLPGIELHSTIAAMAARDVENVDVTLVDTPTVSLTAMISRQPQSERFFYTSLGVTAGESSAEVSFQEFGGRAHASVSARDFTFVCGKDGDEVDLLVGGRAAIHVACSGAQEAAMTNRGVSSHFPSHIPFAEAVITVSTDDFNAAVFFVQKSQKDLAFGFFDVAVTPVFGATFGGILSNEPLLTESERSIGRHKMTELLVQNVRIV